MKNKFLIIILLFCLFVLSGSLVSVYAQSPDDREIEPASAPTELDAAIPEPSENQELAENQVITETITVGPSGRLNLTLGQLGYGSDQFNGGQPQGRYRIELPGNFKISPTGNYLNLVTSHLVSTPDQPASLQIAMNEKPLAVMNLTLAENGIVKTTRIDLSEKLLRPGRNDIDLNLNTGLSCEEPGATAEVLVDPNSVLSFDYEQVPYTTDLSLYPFPFVENSLLDIPVTIILPDSPTENDLSTAATIAAGLGRMTRGDLNLTAVLAGEIEPDVLGNSHLILVGKAEENSVLAELDLPLPLDNSFLEEGQGILEEVVSPWNEFRLALVVSGLDDAGLFKAGQALNRQAHFLGMQGPVAVVLELLPLSEADLEHEASMTLASLEYDDEVAYGALPREFIYDFELPLAWRLEEAPFFVLKFAHADILDPYQSLLDIKLNNLPIGSTLLDKSNANSGELTVTLPANQLRAGRNRLEIGVQMHLSNVDPCNAANDPRAWTVISSESEIFLPYNPLNVPPDLKLLPYPFSQNSGFDQTLIVLPDQPDTPVLNDLIQIAIHLGSASQTEFIAAHVAFASNIDEAAKETYHFVLLGRSTENSLLKEVNEILPQPFEPGSDILKPLAIDNVAFLPDPNRDAGLLEIVVSPWNENNALLAITGTTDAGVDLALQTLLENSNELKGNLAVVEPNPDPLAEEPNQISVYSIDTRTRSLTDEESSIQGSLSESDLVLLSKRWWR